MTERYDTNISILKKIKNDQSTLQNNGLAIISQIDEIMQEYVEMFNYYKPFIFDMFKDKGMKKVVFIFIKQEIKNVNISKKIYNKFNKDEKKIIDIFIKIIISGCCSFPFTEVSIDCGEIIFDIDTNTIDIEYYNKNLIAKNIFSKKKKLNE